MGMGYGANFADVIEEEELKKFGKCGELVDKFYNFFEGKDIDLRSACYALTYGDADEADMEEKEFIELQKIANAIDKEFDKNTGLNVAPDYHDANDDGDRYDEVDGLYWTVSGIWEKTPAGKKIGEKVQRKFFVTFG